VLVRPDNWPVTRAFSALGSVSIPSTFYPFYPVVFLGAASFNGQQRCFAVGSATK
jgi:hypothetical protein